MGATVCDAALNKSLPTDVPCFRENICEIYILFHSKLDWLQFTLRRCCFMMVFLWQITKSEALVGLKFTGLFPLHSVSNSSHVIVIHTKPSSSSHL